MVENYSGNALRDRRLRLLEEAGAGTRVRLRGGPSTRSVTSQPMEGSFLSISILLIQDNSKCEPSAHKAPLGLHDDFFQHDVFDVVDLRNFHAKIRSDVLSRAVAHVFNHLCVANSKRLNEVG